ncbi:LysR family transcriptional regulator [Vibrio sp. HN007]|uniref:LysR family transcriptional regulator n=1 Tax=Vibrio iocasae TaxID=3098914 RepID=UPI0035D4B196
MDIATRLDLFIDIVYQGSFAKAAELRHMDRAVVTKQFKMLEETLGVRLLNRTTRSLSLTDAGREILEQAKVIRKEISKTQRLAESFHTEPRGLLRITSNVSFGNLYLQKAINLFMKKYPDTYVELSLDDRMADIVGEKFDIAFRMDSPKDSTNIAKKLASTKLVLLASPDFIEQHGDPQTLKELVALPAITYSNGPFTLDKLEMAASGQDKMERYSINGRFKANSVDSLISATQAGLGYSIVDLSVLRSNIKELGLVPILQNYRFPSEFGSLHAVYPHRNQTPLVKKFIETVQEEMGTPPVWYDYVDNYSSMYV